MATDRLLQYISDGYLQVGADWRVRAANARVEGLLLRHGQPVVGCTLWEVMPDILGSPAEREIRAVAAGTVPRRVEHFSPTKYIWVEAFVVPGADGCELFVQNVSNRAKVMETDAVRAAVRRILMHAPWRSPSRGARAPLRDAERARPGARRAGATWRGSWRGRPSRSWRGAGLFEALDEVYRTGVPYVGRAVPVRYDREGDGTLVDAVFDFTYQPLLEPDGRVWGIMSVAVEATGGGGADRGGAAPPSRCGGYGAAFAQAGSPPAAPRIERVYRRGADASLAAHRRPEDLVVQAAGAAADLRAAAGHPDQAVGEGRAGDAVNGDRACHGGGSRRWSEGS
jgi:hypothetical protein